MEELLKEYKRISDKILYEIMKDDLESAENSMKVRQNILNKLSELSINKNIDIEKEFGILTVDKKIEEELQKSKLNLKEQLDEIKRQIDLAAQYKINRVHLHLSDDQGWRLEIKKYRKSEIMLRVPCRQQYEKITISACKR